MQSEWQPPWTGDGRRLGGRFEDQHDPDRTLVRWDGVARGRAWAVYASCGGTII